MSDSNNATQDLRSLPVGAEVDREAIFAADSPRDLTHVEVLAIAALEAWADEHGRNIQSWEVTGSVSDTMYDDMMTLVSKALDHVHNSDMLVLGMGRRSSRLEAAQRIREGSVRGAS